MRLLYHIDEFIRQKFNIQVNCHGGDEK